MKAMKRTYRHSTIRHSNSPMSWLLLSLLLLCLTACSTADMEEESMADTENPNNSIPKKTPTQLYIYVFSSQASIPTRSYSGYADPIENEHTVYSLQIWVFTHTTNKLIGYFSPAESSALNEPGGHEVYQLAIDEVYAQTEEASREHVDVYVLANVKEANCHLTFDQSTTKAELEDALLVHGTEDAFGLTAPVRAVPENAGLPMSGVLRDQPVTGTAPVLRLDNAGQVAMVSLVRAVSKLRFAFSRQTDSESLQINSIRLNTEMIPVAEYLFMTDAKPYNEQTCHIKTESGYDTAISNLLDETIAEVATNDDPVIYAWDQDQSPQVYESLLDAAVANGYITQRVYFLRESDKLLQGEIKYQIGDGEEQTATFHMKDTNGFSRNHIWTIYAYLAYAHLQVVVAEVTPWRLTEDDHEFYNW